MSPDLIITGAIFFCIGRIYGIIEQKNNKNDKCF